MRTAALTLCLLTVAATSGCASAPARPADDAARAAPPTDCSSLGADLTRAEQALRDAAGKQADAWKAVVPFAVAARYASGKAAVADAQRQIDTLRAAATRQGCDHPAS
jgi:hypothetical protein